MVSHPDSLINFGLIRHQEMQSECARYRLSTQAAPARREAAQFAGTRAKLRAIAQCLRTQLRELNDPEKLLEAFARMHYPMTM